ncbi:MAG: alpha-galactosidase [Aquisalinus sp.]|nr:alpha-galactosidase [Aquisalinus sp.]
MPFSIFPQHGQGFSEEPALAGTFGKGPWETAFTVVEAEKTKNTIVFHCRDTTKKLTLDLSLSVCPESGILEVRTSLQNDNTIPFSLQRLASLCLPLPSWVNEALLFNGKWADEGHLEKIPLFCGKIERTSRQGRPGFDWPQFALLTDKCTTHQNGKVLAAHLGWSGNHQLIIEQNNHDESQLQVGEWLAPGEVSLKEGETFHTPSTYIAVSHNGLNGIRQRFHKFVRSGKTTAVHRPIHLNTWEGVYFDVDEQSVIELTQQAAELGVERFILDDGWFIGRADDTSSLGDWKPDPQRFPDGLKPIIESVHNVGMTFGLWVEPEMVNPESELFKRYPEWVIQASGFANTTGRNQLVLDLTKEEVQKYILKTISTLLSRNKIDYLKWDYNRALYPGSNDEGPLYREQALALYDILEALKKQYPEVSIESCSSGGGRIDFGILKYTDRVWPSDNTDAIERVRIQCNLGLFLPPEIMGCHAGPAPYEMTGRNLPMDFRCLVALFGHFGAELDPRKLSAADADTFRHFAALYKEHRELIHSGIVWILDTPEETEAQIITSPNGDRALLRLLSTSETEMTVPIKVAGVIDPENMNANLLYSTHTPDPVLSKNISLPPGPSGQLFLLERTSHD